MGWLRKQMEDDMAKTVVGLIENEAEAKRAVEEMLAAGFDKKDVGVIVSEKLARETSAAVTGASTGMLVGGLAGMLLAAAAITIPGIGPVLVAGPGVLLVGTALGVVAGGLIGGLVKRGVPEEDAHLFAEGIKRGATLVVATARTDDLAAKAVVIMKRHGAVDLEKRAEEWRKQGWTGRMADAVASPAPSQATAGGVSAAPEQQAASGGTGTPAQQTASGTAQPPGIACVRVYEFEIVEPTVRSPYTGPERRVKNIPFEPERRMAA
jgi:hypothetical protein